MKGNVADCRAASALLCDLAPGTLVLADKAHDKQRDRDLIESQGTVPNTPSKTNRRWKSCVSKTLYEGRNAVKRAFCRLKDCRRIATRYDKLAANFLGAICLAAAVTWWILVLAQVRRIAFARAGDQPRHAKQRRIWHMMVSSRSLVALAVFAALPLPACSLSDDTPANQTTATETPATGGVTREEIKAEEAPVQAMAPMAVIQSQPGPDGSQVDLLKVAVTGDILTVTMRCSSQENINSESFKISEISIIDDATSQRIGVLKDDEGNALVSDLNKSVSSRDNDYLGADCETKPGVIWAKFPAPPATSKTISINFPEIAPFDGVTVTR